MTNMSCNLSSEPVKIATVNFGTSLQNAPYNSIAGTYDGTSESVGIYGSEGSDSPGAVGGIDVSMFIIIKEIIVLIKLWLMYH